MTAMPPSDERYARAAEFIDVVSACGIRGLMMRYKLTAMGCSLIPPNFTGASCWQAFSGSWTLKYFAWPQGRPALFQAGASEAGRQLAARYAEESTRWLMNWPAVKNTMQT